MPNRNLFAKPTLRYSTSEYQVPLGSTIERFLPTQKWVSQI